MMDKVQPAKITLNAAPNYLSHMMKIIYYKFHKIMPLLISLCGIEIYASAISNHIFAIFNLKYVPATGNLFHASIFNRCIN